MRTQAWRSVSKTRPFSLLIRGYGTVQVASPLHHAHRNKRHDVCNYPSCCLTLKRIDALRTERRRTVQPEREIPPRGVSHQFPIPLNNSTPVLTS